MSSFRYRNLMVNLGQQQAFCRIFTCNFFSGCGNTGCGNFPNTCHVITCLGGSIFCGIPSCNFSGPIDCAISNFAQDPAGPITLATLKRDLKEAIREIEELEAKQGADAVEAALKQVDEAKAELDQLRDSLRAKRRGKG